MLKVGEPSLRARGVCSREILVLIMEARCGTMVEPSLRTARPSRTTLLLMIVEARCTIMMEPALELTACAKKIPQKTFMCIMEIAISVLAVRDLEISILQHFYWGIWTISRRAHFGGGGDA